jgi:hypothetical protein
MPGQTESPVRWWQAQETPKASRSAKLNFDNAFCFKKLFESLKTKV